LWFILRRCQYPDHTASIYELWTGKYLEGRGDAQNEVLLPEGLIRTLEKTEDIQCTGLRFELSPSRILSRERYRYTNLTKVITITSRRIIVVIITTVACKVWRLYKTGIGLTTGFIGSHTVTHNYSVCTLQLTTVHINTCRIFTLYLHWLPVFHYRRIRSPATLQLFSEDRCSARILTRNCQLETARNLRLQLCRLNWLAGALGYIAREQTTKTTPPLILYCCMTSPERTPKKTPSVTLAIVACLSVAIATVVNTWHIAYSIHVTLSLLIIKSSSLNSAEPFLSA
jgi:hypothetical protein